MSTGTRYCPHCGSLMTADSPGGLCPRCVMGLGFAAGLSPEPETETEAIEPPEGRPVAAPPSVSLTGPAQGAGRSQGGTTGGLLRRFVPPSPTELAAVFPQLEVLELIGQGGMGAVYKARQRGLDRLVALKILPPEAAEDPAFAERFHREARALARLNHPHIVTVYDSGLAGPYFYFLMEFVDGVNLRQAMRTSRIQPHEALAIVPQICEALQYAHDEGLVHRDIKPENVLLDRKGRVKVADFGLAKLLAHDPLDITLTGTHQVVGTPRYMAPEQLAGARDIDHRADIYSLGVVFYELLTGDLPLGRFPAPSKKAAVSPQLDQIVLRTLESEPQERYQQASDLKSDVDQLLGAPEPVYRNSSIAGVTSFGRDDRSKATLFGWPLVHIATGIDPATGRRRQARGIIAIGEQAYGLIAIGGQATGGLAIGGIARGGIALGGVAMGGIAIGGVALGLLCAGGGIALGTVAVGGAALGLWVEGGAALGLGLRDMLASWSGSPATSMAVHPTRSMLLAPMLAIVLIVVGLFTVIGVVGTASHRRRREAAAAPAVPPRVFPPPPPLAAVVPATAPRQGNHSATWVWVLLIPLVCCPCLILGPAAWVIPVRTVREATPQSIEHAHSSLANPAPEWQWTDAGPRLDRGLQEWIGITPKQTSQINAVVERYWQKYLEREATLTRSAENKMGRFATTVQPLPPAELTRLEDEFWSEIDPLLDASQQDLARRKLRTTSHSTPQEYNLSPGLFGWGRAGAEIEVWKVGSWYHYTLRTPTSGHSLSASFPLSPLTGTGSGPTLPPYVRRFAPPASGPAPGTPTPEAPAPGKSVPEWSTPGKMDPRKRPPDSTTPGKSIPESATPGKVAPRTLPPDSTTPGKTIPESTAPETTVPEKPEPAQDAPASPAAPDKSSR
ncbi:MAG: protein kinase [Pirellulales bacterium]